MAVEPAPPRPRPLALAPSGPSAWAAVVAAAAAAEAEANTERWTEEAKRTIQELPIHNLPERYLRFKCTDRPTAKALAKAISNEKLYPPLERLEEEEEESAAEAVNEVESVESVVA